MEPTRFNHLHCHTEASPDGLMPVEALVNHAAELGFTHLSMTDHGTLTNAVAFHAACEAAGIIPILGLEGYYNYGGHRNHITLNALNQDGFNNLIKINNYSHDEGWRSGYPTFGIEQLNAWGSGIVAGTGCPASALHKGSLLDGLNYVAQLVDALGKENVFAEEMFVMDTDYIARPKLAAERFGIPIVVTNDVHFPFQGQGEIHSIMSTCRKGFDYTSDGLYLKTEEDMLIAGASWATAAELKQWMRNTSLITDRVVPFSMSADPILPVDPGSEVILRGLVDSALEKYLLTTAHPETIVKARVEKEWGILEGAGFLDYFYILNDIVHWAKGQGIRVGHGRGSAAGSLILYLLGVTLVDPLDHNLLFERFLNVHRGESPDVDVDFDSSRRNEVIAYAHERWGAFPIATYSRYGHASLVRDLGRVLHIDRDVTDAASERGEESKAFETFCEKHPNALKAYNAMSGQIRHRGKHPGGIVITPRPVPIERAGEHLVVAWTEGGDKQLSFAGIVKYDFLGLNALTEIEAMISISGVEPEAPVKGHPAFSVFKEGNVGGIFQWTGSEFVRKLTMDIQPNSLEDLSTINGLNRPGPIDSGMAEQYPEFVTNPNKHHHLIDRFLEETHGVFVYQEQVMEVVATMMGGGYETADLARRKIVKAKPDDPKSIEEVRKLEDDFKRESKANGYPQAVINNVWNEIVTFARYGFNKSHCVCYTMISWQQAWFKHTMPEVFFTAKLQCDAANAQQWLFEAAAAGIPIVTPDINTSGDNYELADGKIFLPLRAIKFFGDKGVAAVIEERDRNGIFKSFDDLNSRVSKRAFNSRVRKLMLNMKSFSGLIGDPSDLIDDYATLPIINDKDAQIEALGFVLPRQEYVDFIRRNTFGNNKVAGFVREIEERRSKKGAFKVYRLSPTGSFWTRTKKYTDAIKIGDLIAVTKASWGDALEVKRKKL